MIRNTQRLLVPLVLVLGCLSAAAQATPPTTLALPDLVQRPDRWPASVKLKREFKFSSGSGAQAGQAVKVLEFNGGQLLVDAGNDVLFEIAPGDCDLLEAANQAWAALTPAQRAVDPGSLQKDASLWPDRVLCHSGFQLEDGTEIAPGLEFEFLYFDGDGVKLYSREHQTTLFADLGQTDLVARARQRAATEPDKRPSRVAAALKSTLVDTAGKPFTSPAIEQGRLYVLYFGASWCGPCRKFSPGLVRLANDAVLAHPRLVTVLMSGDQEDADMLAYMKEEKMPWPAMPLATLKETPLFLSQGAGYIPHMVVLDRHGLVLASSVEGGQYVGPDKALKALEKLLESGAAK